MLDVSECHTAARISCSSPATSLDLLSFNSSPILNWIDVRVQMCDSVSGGAECQETANSFASMTAMFGKSFHENGMRDACDCVSEEEAPGRFQDYVKFMYEKYNKDGIKAVPAVGVCKPSPESKPCTSDEKIEALVEKYSTGKGGKKKHPGRLFWKLVNTYKHIEWVRDGEMGLAKEECEVAEREGKRFGEQ